MGAVSTPTRSPASVACFAVALHRQLLQVRGQALQVLVVGQHRERRRAEEVVVPDRQQAEQRRHALLDRRAAEMLVHRVEAGQHLAELLGPMAISVDRPIAESIE